MSINAISSLVWIIILALTLGYSINSIKEDLKSENEYNTKLTTHVVMTIVLAVALIYECCCFRL